MKNPKKAGTDYEKYICELINKLLGSKFALTQRSGGSIQSVDIFDRTKSTPLSEKSIEIKNHSTEKQFKAFITKDLEQAARQNMAGNCWMLITKNPITDRPLVIMDLEDYLITNILAQMVLNRSKLKDLLKNCDSSLRDLTNNFEVLRKKLNEN